jgi:hypothetical protein
MCGVVDPISGYAYFGSESRIVKVAVGDELEFPSRIGAVQLSDRHRDVRLAVIDLEHQYAYFANDDSILKVALGEDSTPPTLVGSSTAAKPQYGQYATYLILPALLPLLVPWVAGSSIRLGGVWNLILILLFVLSMVASIVELHFFGKHALYGSFLTVPPITVAFFFLLPLCQSFLDGVAAGREALQGTSGIRAWQAFRRVLFPRSILWLALWVIYLIGLELFMEHKFGGGNWITSGLCASLVLGMFASCFVWARRCKQLSALCLLTVISSFAVVAVFIAAAVWLIAVVDGGGYMGLGYLFAPVVAAGFLLIFAAVCTRYAVRKGDAWFG